MRAIDNDDTDIMELASIVIMDELMWLARVG